MTTLEQTPEHAASRKRQRHTRPVYMQHSSREAKLTAQTRVSLRRWRQEGVTYTGHDTRASSCRQTSVILSGTVRQVQSTDGRL
jgi:hypothetical protein